MKSQENPLDKKRSEQGLEALSTVELLALLLKPEGEKTDLALAKRLLHEFPNLQSLFEAHWEEVQQIEGMTEAKYATLKMVLEWIRRDAQKQLDEAKILPSIKRTRSFLINQLSDLERQVFVCLFFDQMGRVISYDKLFMGTLNGVSIYTRTVIKQALFYNATSVIFAVNHPCGSGEPRRDEILKYRELCEAMGLIEVVVLNYFVVSDNECLSLADKVDWLEWLDEGESE
ncbi:MAG TPA: DNA repair protein RadC [Thiotrichaceae bacterium]|nr:DNA repair protein RadC [Thiotrichaceae bacterium]